jgi:hypothetical protein
MNFTPLYIINSQEIYAPFDDDLKKGFIDRIKINKQLKEQIIDFKRKYRNAHKYDNLTDKKTMEIFESNIHSTYGFKNNDIKYKYSYFTFLNVKKNLNGKTNNKGYDRGYLNLLNKEELLLWCVMNNIKVKKSLKYCDIVKVLYKNI